MRKGITLSNLSLWLGKERESTGERASWSLLHHLFGHPAVIRSWVSCQPQMKLPDFLDFVYTCRASAPPSTLLLHCRCLGAPYLCNILYFHEFPPPTQPQISVCLSGFLSFFWVASFKIWFGQMLLISLLACLGPRRCDFWPWSLEMLIRIGQLGQVNKFAGSTQRVHPQTDRQSVRSFKLCSALRDNNARIW